MTTTRHLGLDLGGTNIKAAVLEYRGSGIPPRLVFRSVVPTNAERGPTHVANRLIAIGRDVRSEIPAIATVGLGIPGLFDIETGAIELFPNLAGEWQGFGLRDVVGEGLGIDVAMINDARAFTLAEGTIGAGKRAHVLLGITLGTGIGGGIMIDGRLHLGAFGNAGEFGHQTVDAEGPLCGCGNRGCLEAVARGGAMAAEAGMTDVEALYAAVGAGDEAAIHVVERASFFMAIAIANAVSLVGVDVVVVGGGIVSSGDLVLDPLRRAVENRITLVRSQDVQIVAAELGPLAGAIGAALAGRDHAPTLRL